MSKLSSVKILEDERLPAIDDLVFHLKAWKHDGTSFLSDEVPGHTCTNSGSLFQYGRGRKLDKIDDFMRVTTSPRITDIKPVTYIAWINPVSTGESDAGGIFYKATAAGAGYGLRLAANNTVVLVRNYVGSSIYRYTANNSLVLNTTQMFICTWDGSITATNIKFYRATPTQMPIECAYGLDNDAVGAYTTDSGYDMYLGNNADTSTTFEGVQGEYIIYKKVLLPSERQQVWRATKGQFV